MSNLTGHYRLTEQAVKELRGECGNHPLLSGLGSADLPIDVVMRDLIDVAIVGHWSDFGQAHHFMRRFDGQSPYEAYEEGVEWIRSNCLDAASDISATMRRWFQARDWSDGVLSTTYRNQCAQPDLVGQKGDVRGVLTFERNSHGNWQAFGNAIHALEDSFASGHAERETPIAPKRPGPICHIRRYAGTEKEGHEHYDELWWDESKNCFSRDGLLAIAAVKELILMVCTSAIRGRGGHAPGLTAWSEFCRTWLGASLKLSRIRDVDFDFLERFTTVVRVGDSLVTLSCNESGLAAALIKEFGTDTSRVTRVFRRLRQHNISVVGDVACEYVKLVRKNENPYAEALRRDPALLNILVDGMHMTDGDQAKCIVYLSNLRSQ
jgi:hypothetical protein